MELVALLVVFMMLRGRGESSGLTGLEAKRNELARQRAGEERVDALAAGGSRLVADQAGPVDEADEAGATEAPNPDELLGQGGDLASRLGL